MHSCIWPRASAVAAEIISGNGSAFGTVPCAEGRALSAALKAEIQIVLCAAPARPAADDNRSVNCLDLVRQSNDAEIVLSRSDYYDDGEREQRDYICDPDEKADPGQNDLACRIAAE